jgi:predicted nucleic acid-binding protein
MPEPIRQDALARHEYDEYWRQSIDRAQAQRAMDERAAREEMEASGLYIVGIILLIGATAVISHLLRSHHP